MRASDYVLKKPLHSPAEGTSIGASRKGGKSGAPTGSSGSQRGAGFSSSNGGAGPVKSPNTSSNSSSSGTRKRMSWSRFMLLLGTACVFGLLLWVNIHVKSTHASSDGGTQIADSSSTDKDNAITDGYHHILHYIFGKDLGRLLDESTMWSRHVMSCHVTRIVCWSGI